MKTLKAYDDREWEVYLDGKQAVFSYIRQSWLSKRLTSLAKLDTLSSVLVKMTDHYTGKVVWYIVHFNSNGYLWEMKKHV
jgi:hypothetical protein